MNIYIYIYIYISYVAMVRNYASLYRAYDVVMHCYRRPTNKMKTAALCQQLRPIDDEANYGHFV